MDRKKEYSREEITTAQGQKRKAQADLGGIYKKNQEGDGKKDGASRAIG